MKSGEIIRIIVCVLISLVLIFYLQPLLYQNRLIRVSDVPLTTWISDYYTVGGWFVFGSSLGATLIWTFMTARAKATGALDVFRWRVVWGLLALLPIVGICIALYFFNESDDALITLTGFFILDAVLLYWLPTVTSSPGLFRNIPPGSSFIRRLIG
ncbi:hypothetical protein [Crocosphaera sp. Alani8]|uniref:hypothetical protein n=1 Tax=Crocosphaera sp. Alani8 TaxID=3038952 RepID=UPI00313CE4D0